MVQQQIMVIFWFQALPSGEEGHQTTVGKTPANRLLNRFRNITACEPSLHVTVSYTLFMLILPDWDSYGGFHCQLFVIYSSCSWYMLVLHLSRVHDLLMANSWQAESCKPFVTNRTATVKLTNVRILLIYWSKILYYYSDIYLPLLCFWVPNSCTKLS